MTTPQVPLLTGQGGEGSSLPKTFDSDQNVKSSKLVTTDSDIDQGDLTSYDKSEAKLSETMKPGDSAARIKETRASAQLREHHPRQSSVSLAGPSDSTAVRKGSNIVTGEIGDSSSQPLDSAGNATQIPEATEIDSSDLVPSQNNTAKQDQSEDFRTECRRVVLGERYKPNIEIIAIHDLGESLESAWAYASDGSFSKRTQKQSQVQGTPECTNKRPLSKAMVKALDEDVSSGKRHFQGWKDRIEPPDQPLASSAYNIADNEDPSNQIDQENPTPTDPNKGKDHTTNDTIPPHQPSAKQYAGPSQTNDMREKKSVDNDRSSHKSNRPSSSNVSTSPSERDKSTKPGNWLTDPTMLAGDLERPQIHTFCYNSPEPRQSIINSSKYPDYNTSLKQVVENAVESIFRYLKEREQDRDRIVGIPVVIIATGFGCLIVQKLISLLAESNEITVFADRIAGIIFMDAPNPILKGVWPAIPFLPPPNSPRATRITAFLESKAIDGFDLWSKFSRTSKEKNLPTVWFYPVAHGTIQTAKPPHIFGIDFVKLDLIQVKPTAKSPSSRFKGPTDPNYRSVVQQIKSCLLFKASSSKKFEGFLTEIVTAKHANDMAMVLLLKTRHDLAIKMDGHRSTALHTVVREAVHTRPSEGDRASFKIMIEKLVSLLSEHQYQDDLKDIRGMSPWNYASDEEFRWIRDLRTPPFLTKGAQAALPKTIKEWMGSTKADRLEKIASQKLDATLTQFYISKNRLFDSLDPQKTDVHTVIYDKAYGITKWFSRILRSLPDMEATCKWIHLPANNLREMGASGGRIEVGTSTPGPQQRYLGVLTKALPFLFLGLAPFDRYITPGAFKYYQPSFASTFTPSSSSVKSADAPSAPKRTAIALFMPIFGFERRGNYRKLRNAMRNPSLPGEDDTTSLIRTYFNRKKLPLHCRRTLDQFAYTMLDNTDRRDRTQVMLRWAKRKNKASRRHDPQGTARQSFDDENYPLLMIDQLWLWVLEDEQTVITSLPNTWTSTENFNFVRYLIENDLSKNNYRPVIEGSMDLANLIIRRGLDLLPLPGPDGVTIHECFQSSITLVAEKQIRQFKKFKKLVKELNKNGIDQQQRAGLTNALFELNTETRLLAEIMDIEDELKSIHRVLVKQEEVVKLFETLINQQHKNGRGSEGKHVRFSDEVTDQGANTWNMAQENVQLARSNIETIDGLIKQAKKVREEINGLLSHRQKHANAWEARFAREGSEHTQRQSNITLVFTLVTVCFLPLSFISSLFAIQIDAYPHDPQTGEVNWPLGKSLGLLLGISFAVILFIALAFYVRRISIFSGRATRDLALLENKGLTGQDYTSASDSDHSTSSEKHRGICIIVDGSSLVKRPQAQNSKWISILYQALALPATVVILLSQSMKVLMGMTIKKKRGEVDMKSSWSSSYSPPKRIVATRAMSTLNSRVLSRHKRSRRFAQLFNKRAAPPWEWPAGWGNDTSTLTTRSVGSMEVDLDSIYDGLGGWSSGPMVRRHEPPEDEPLGDEPLGEEQHQNEKESRPKSVFAFPMWTKEKETDLESGKEK
ncbi:hypothetical protein F5Y08DRAFT_344349 [Xylaria arbuscula]|nr:hypothetical protein F5Y08DRAFT_344349 [Xylaria arbuscula]